MPETPEDLFNHRMVGYAASQTGQPYALDFTIDGKVHEISLPHDVLVKGAEIYTASGVAGLGLIQVPRYRVAHQIQSGQLVSILENYPPPKMPVSVLYPHNRHIAGRVRVFVDWLAALFRTAQSEGRI